MKLTKDDAEIKEKLSLIRERKHKAALEIEESKVKKIDQLRLLLCALTYDEAGLSGMEQKLKPIMDESEMQTIKDKIFDIIAKL